MIPIRGRINGLTWAMPSASRARTCSGECLAVDAGQCRNKALQHQRGLAGAGHAGRQSAAPWAESASAASPWSCAVENGCSCANGASANALSPRCPPFRREEGRSGTRVAASMAGMVDHIAALCPGFQPHFHDQSASFKIACRDPPGSPNCKSRDQVVHHAGQAHDVGGCRPMLEFVSA